MPIEWKLTVGADPHWSTEAEVPGTPVIERTLALKVHLEFIVAMLGNVDHQSHEALDTDLLVRRTSQEISLLK